MFLRWKKAVFVTYLICCSNLRLVLKISPRLWVWGGSQRWISNSEAEVMDGLGEGFRADDHEVRFITVEGGGWRCGGYRRWSLIWIEKMRGNSGLCQMWRLKWCCCGVTEGRWWWRTLSLGCWSQSGLCVSRRLTRQNWGCHCTFGCGLCSSKDELWVQFSCRIVPLMFLCFHLVKRRGVPGAECVDETVLVLLMASRSRQEERMLL